MYKPLRKKQSAESAIHKPSRRLSALFIPFSDGVGLVFVRFREVRVRLREPSEFPENTPVRTLQTPRHTVF